MNATDFKTQVLQLFFQDMHRLEHNNYSYRRFSYDGVDRSTVFNVARHAMFMSWFCDSYAKLFTAWSRLADQPSRELYVDLIRYRLAGHLHVRIRNKVHELQAECERFQAAMTQSPSVERLGGMFGEIVHHEGVWGGESYQIDTVPGGMEYALVLGQYYFARDGIRIAPEQGDHVIDAGAFTGDSSVIFSKSVGATGRVYAFDPVENHLRICRLNFASQGCENIVLLPYAIGARGVDAPTVTVDEYAPGYRASSSEIPIPMRRIDDLVIDRRIERIDFLKMDVEGSEMAGLRGAESSIRRFRPKLAISIYHKPDDIFDIVNWVHDLDIGYELFVDHYTIHEEETVLYARA